jgi:hypothetical protein
MILMATITTPNKTAPNRPRIRGLGNLVKQGGVIGISLLGKIASSLRVLAMTPEL